MCAKSEIETPALSQFCRAHEELESQTIAPLVEAYGTAQVKRSDLATSPKTGWSGQRTGNTESPVPGPHSQSSSALCAQCVDISFLRQHTVQRYLAPPREESRAERMQVDEPWWKVELHSASVHPPKSSKHAKVTSGQLGLYILWWVLYVVWRWEQWVVDADSGRDQLILF
ncbi:unnamed protein product [Pleuronectes platessa]|uniref:Uncharacterized protein n=1 Tax=Pleuronectes platessa TaxID=8262 RepID=A0A9N7VRM7_PLEPL|nr:unnamed protein product [Pleuronectes platessa]